jgi:hypothetical protein
LVIRFRTFKYAFSADVEKMYRSIPVDKSQWDLQRIMYCFDGESKTRHFHLKTLTYRTASAPFLAILSLEFISQSIGKEEKRLENMITKGFYLDDLIYGSDDEAETINLVNKIYTLFKKHGMILRKWSSNFPTCLREIKDGHTLLDLKEMVKAKNKVST